MHMCSKTALSLISLDWFGFERLVEHRRAVALQSGGTENHRLSPERSESTGECPMHTPLHIGHSVLGILQLTPVFTV
jgi:hypothetical protein